MRIALFTEVFTPKVDGVVTRLRHTLDELEALGHEVLVFAPGEPPKRHGRHHVVKAPSLAFKPWYPEIQVGMPAPRLLTRLRRYNPDVVHAVNPVWLAAAGVIAAGLLEFPLLASYHTNVPEYAARLGLSALERPSQAWIVRMHNRAQVNLCPSLPMVDRAKELGIQRVGLWPKAVDSVSYHPDNRDQAMRERLTGGHPEAPLILYVGRLSREKDLDQLLEPVRRLAERGARMAFVGSGPGAEELREMFVGTPTVFTGYLTGAELASAYASADVFAFPSTTDTLGQVAMEAMASGVPVVGADAGGIPYVVDDGHTGFLVTPSDLDGWTKRLGQLTGDPELRRTMGQAARADAEQHSWAAATKTVVAAYEQAIADHHRAVSSA